MISFNWIRYLTIVVVFDDKSLTSSHIIPLLFLYSFLLFLYSFLLFLLLWLILFLILILIRLFNLEFFNSHMVKAKSEIKVYKVERSEELFLHRVLYNLHNKLLSDNMGNLQSFHLITWFNYLDWADKSLRLKLFLSCCWKFNISVLVEKDRHKIVGLSFNFLLTVDLQLILLLQIPVQSIQ